ncbi:heme exporter protein CcmB [Asaia bogorensis]|uniref:Heme exporter protein B n=1 Tax=Asaia bogorensis NBRC 16594 TaxID=1231624 RepID=A0AAN4R0W0_9PROT|nr:heme exporter protein CcmB [Asaia bogorensis]BAT20348.1 heme exporter protein B [Asaia bogorensis NBRC 16594]GBQ79628.1 heme exporter protein B [Asaia bogorensis NBRC 16594]GEL52230.1 heme exporter protein B [Asaia bogorensis NBRC 16594]
MLVSAFLSLIRRDLSLAVRFGADTLAAVLFFVLCASLFPLALGPSPVLLHRMAPGIIWVCALLASLLPLDRLFGAELDDGGLDHLLLLGLPPSLVALAKIIAHWLTTGVPLLVAAGPLTLMLGGTPGDILPLLAGLVPGTALLSLLGGMAAGLVLGARRGSILLPLLTLPLSSPVLIFGAAAADATANGQSNRVELSILGAFLALALPLCPLAAGSGLRAATS